MDKSELYIKMCEKAQEIQEQHQTCLGLQYANEGDYVYANGRVYLVKQKSWTDKHIWLPTQEDLQEMVIGEGLLKLSAYGLLCQFHNWLGGRMGYYFGFKKAPLGYHPSMEILWLAFVMKENYSKVWNGEDWIND